MDIIVIIISVIVLLCMALSPLLKTMHDKRTVNNTYDKSVVYLASELSFTPEKWNDIKDKIDYDQPNRISVPFITIWKGMYGYQFSIFGRIGAIWYGLLCLSLFAMIGFSKTPLKPFTVDIMNIMLILALGIGWFLYNFRSFAAYINELCLRSDCVITFLLELGWDNIDEKLIDTVKDEIRVDFDLYKKETGISGGVLLMLSSSLLFYLRVNEIFSIYAAISFVYIFASIFISKWLYDSYRSRLIEISLNSIIGLKKNIQLQK